METPAHVEWVLEVALRALTAVDLFSGCGGLTLGLRQAGFRVLGAVEIDPLAVETFSRNHPNVRVWQSDICRLPANEMMRELGFAPGEVDLLAGCPPCQGFSTLTTLNGKNAGDDPRNELLFEFVRFARVLRPKAIMMENVPGLTKDGRLAMVRKSLESLGYQCEVRVLDAADFGVPQRRRRMILLAGRGGKIEFARKGVKRRTVRETFKRLGEKRRLTDALHNLPESRSQSVMELIQSIPRNGGSRKDLGRRSQLQCHLKCDGFSDVYGRMTWDDVAPTITGGCCNPSKGRFLHPSANRVISLREAAMLQSFPVTYEFVLRRGKFAVAQMIGNALPPEFIRRHSVKIAKFIQNMNDPQ